MAHLHEGLDQVEAQLSLTDGELALNALARNITSTQTELQSAEQSLAFTRGYQPVHPGPRPHPEAGGMDHEDYTVAAWEYAYHDEDTELDMHRYSAVIDDAEETLSELFDLKERVDTGDEATTQSVATKERARLEEVKKEALRAQERRDGVEMAGAKELYDKVSSRITRDALKGVATKKTAQNGWERENFYISGFGQQVFFRNPGKGPLGQYTEAVGITVHEGEKPSIHVSYIEIPEDAGVVYGDDIRRTTKRGEVASFSIDEDGVVRNHTYRMAYANQGNNAGNYRFPGKAPTVKGEGAIALDFTDKEIAKMDEVLGGLVADVESLKT